MRGNTFNQPEVEHIGFLQTVDETDKETYLSINTLRPFLAGFLLFLHSASDRVWQSELKGRPIKM